MSVVSAPFHPIGSAKMLTGHYPSTISFSLSKSTAPHLTPCFHCSRGKPDRRQLQHAASSLAAGSRGGGAGDEGEPATIPAMSACLIGAQYQRGGEWAASRGLDVIRRPLD